MAKQILSQSLTYAPVSIGAFSLMPQKERPEMLCQMQVTPLVVNPVCSLKKLREEWQETGADLLAVKAPVGLLLYDVCQSLGLSPDDTGEVLGPDLFGQALS
jgi:hypothetical protein